jgi:hypothetical protein
MTTPTRWTIRQYNAYSALLLYYNGSSDQARGYLSELRKFRTVKWV